MIINKKEHNIPVIDSVKFVQKGNGAIKGYAVNTFQGAIKNFNEDRVSIIMNITKPNHKGRWPKCSYFGVFDGHGGAACSNFLKDNLHKFITENTYFPNQPIDALKLGFKKAEYEFTKFAESQTPLERSGSCAIVILIVDSICYIGNVGDSRAILSSNRGSKVYSLSNDHKPDSPSEKERIQKANGKIYQSIIKTKSGVTIPGPFRISPGKLSVSRAFGDIQAKIEALGGNHQVLIAKPEITYFEINHEEHDFIIVGSDGIYDKLTNTQIADCFWSAHTKKNKNSYSYIGESCSQILNQSMAHYSMDNITSLIIVFEDQGRLDLPTKYNIPFKQNNKTGENLRQENNEKHWTNGDEEQKENISKMLINGVKSDRGNSAKLIEKITMNRKNSSSYLNKSEFNSLKDHQKTNDNKNSSKIKKQKIGKGLSSASLKPELKTMKQAKQEKDSLIQKLLKSKNVERLR